MVSFCFCIGFFFCDVISYNVDRRTADMLLLSNDNYQESYQLVIQLERLLHNTAGSKVGCLPGELLLAPSRLAPSSQGANQQQQVEKLGSWCTLLCSAPILCALPLLCASTAVCALYSALLHCCLLCSAGCSTCNKWLHLLSSTCCDLQYFSVTVHSEQHYFNSEEPSREQHTGHCF